MQSYYDLFHCWVRYRVGFILLICIYVDACLLKVNQYYRRKKIERVLSVKKKIKNALTFFKSDVRTILTLFIVNFELVSQLGAVFLLLTLSR